LISSSTCFSDRKSSNNPSSTSVSVHSQLPMGSSAHVSHKVMPRRSPSTSTLETSLYKQRK
jgi:hypothetical protein